MNDAPGADFRLGVVGAGAMGQGIVQVALTGGMDVVLLDASAEAAHKARDTICSRLDRLVEKGRLTGSAVSAIKPRLRLARDASAFASADVVIEAVFEDLAIKHEVFAELEQHVGDDCVLASNSSSLLIAAIARNCRNRGRVAGMHFFNPVPLMSLVEVVRGPETRADVVALLMELGRRLGRTPVTVRDAPGFLVNLGGRAYTTEAVRLLHEGVAAPADIDAVMRDCHGFRMGPCELMDLTGIDVNLPVTDLIASGYSDDPRLRTFFPHRALFEAGRFGRKTGNGHYRYDAGGQIGGGLGANPGETASAERARSLCVPDGDAALQAFARTLASETGCAIGPDDDGACPVLVAPRGEDCTTVVANRSLDVRRTVALDLSGDTAKRITVMTAPGADTAVRDAAIACLRASGRAVTAIADSPGFIGQRISAMVANLGCEMAQIGLAGPEEIDLAMRLGLNYPRGPLELCSHLGVDKTTATLERMQAITGEDRYRPSLWLRRRALLGLDIHTPN